MVIVAYLNKIVFLQLEWSRAPLVLQLESLVFLLRNEIYLQKENSQLITIFTTRKKELQMVV